MVSIERAIARATRIARTDTVELGRQFRIRRLSRGWSQAEVARRSGFSSSKVGRIELGQAPRAAIDDLVRIGAALGLTVRIKGYPGADPTLDAAQVSVIRRVRTLLPERVRMPLEVGLPIEGDQRAWDAEIRGLVSVTGETTPLPVDVETRFIDAQAQIRHVMLKLRDSGASAVLLVLADTDANRRAVRSVHDIVRSNFPVSARAALAALRAGRHPGGSALVFI